jgi:hypothetical protein
MAFDQKTRNLLQRTVTACRRAFDREFTAQLQELYGIQPDGAITPCAELDHLADEALEVARLLRSRINHLEGGEPAEALTRTQARPEHVARVIREQAFTVLNRLAALRLCEERGLVLECVRRGINSEGFQLFLTSAGNALGETHEAYRVYLHSVFDELSLDLGVLFDRFSPLALLFPRKDALEEVLRELNGSGKAAASDPIPAEQFAEIWQTDEAIGWIYQYYNDEAERKKMREDSPAPRDSRDLAVRNQFFTPRYVVEFLTDNTLGRVWYEMLCGQTSLSDGCRYLVRRPTEIFLKAGETAPENSTGSEVQEGELISQEDLLRQPVYISHRPLKDPREIRLLDPACGSMHFGLYAFDLLTIIYDEAWDIAHGPNDAAKSAATFAPFVTFAVTFRDKAAFLLEVPRLIIERNIHGIDIDRRAAQIAGLSLWLRAQRAWHQAGVKPADRPRITRSNLVCAEPMPGEKDLLREFVEQQFLPGERPAFAFLLERIFDRMSLAGEAGSLLRIEEEIRAAVAHASAHAQSQSSPHQTRLWSGDERPEQADLDLRGLNDEQFWKRAEQRIYDALEAYAEQAENGGGFQRRLFADDAAHGFAFIDLCRKRYDVVVMNPPFGSGPILVQEYLQRVDVETWTELFTAMVSRGLGLAPNGLVGSITSRTCLTLTRLTDWRVRDLVPKAELIADLGLGVMDNALVQACAYVSRPKSMVPTIMAKDLQSSTSQPEELVAECWNSPATTHLIERSGIKGLPEQRILLGLPPQILRLLQSKRLFEPTIGTVRRGFVLFDGFRFVRLSWEVAPSSIGSNRAWAWYSKGGEYQRNYGSVHVVALRDNGGAEMCAVNLSKNGQTAQAMQGSTYYFRPGSTYTSRSQRGFAARCLPAGCITSDSPAVLSESSISDLLILGWLNSRIIRLLIELQASFNKYEPGHVKSLPWPPIVSSIASEVEKVNLENILLTRQLCQWDETDATFQADFDGRALNEMRDAWQMDRQGKASALVRNQIRVTDLFDSVEHPK